MQQKTAPVGAVWGRDITDCHTSDVGHWLAMTGVCGECGARRHTWVPPYRVFCRAGVRKRAG